MNVVSCQDGVSSLMVASYKGHVEVVDKLVQQGARVDLQNLRYVSFSNSNTRSTTHLKLKHSLSKTHADGHFYFNRLPRLWNSLPPLNLNLSLHTIKKNLWQLFWTNFEHTFQSNMPCSFHLICPCSRCVTCSVSVNYSM